MRVVLDTNILISAFLWKGTPKEIFKLAQEGKLKICVSKEIIEEFQRVLAYPKFQQRLTTIAKTPADTIDEFLEIVEYYDVRKLGVVVIKEDPTDDKFLACAQTCQASFIISGNGHVLKLKQFQGILIVSAREFLRIVKT